MSDFNIWVGIFTILAGISTFATAIIMIIDFLETRKIPIHLSFEYSDSDGVSHYKLHCGHLKHKSYYIERIELKNNQGNCYFADSFDNGDGSIKLIPSSFKWQLHVGLSVSPQFISSDVFTFEFSVFGVDDNSDIDIVFIKRPSVKRSKRTISLYRI